MNENERQKKRQQPKRSFSIEEKRNYCMAWEKSGMNQSVFCEANRISNSALHKWSKEFKKENNELGFSPLVLEQKPLAKQIDIIQISICFPNQMQLSIAMPEHGLISFIQELGDATTVVR